MEEYSIDGNEQVVELHNIYVSNARQYTAFSTSNLVAKVTLSRFPRA